MELYDAIGIKEELLNDLVNVFRKYNITRAVVFGSRATGEFKYNSDVDICVFSENLGEKKSLLIDEINQLNTALSFDILFFEDISKEELKENILKEEVVIYDSGKSE